MKASVVLFFGLVAAARNGSPEYFIPANRVSGIGASRDDISDELLQARTDLMIQSQTFAIMRDPEALNGARRITGDRQLQAVFRSAAARSGFPAELLEAIAYLESWGDPRAESPAGPKGIMQISQATARSMGLTVKNASRYRVVRERVRVKSNSKKPKYRTVKRRIPYSVLVRDDRLKPERAIPAAANYLAGMERTFGGRDWAIFAYHCGQGCASRMQEVTRASDGIGADQVSVARMFFSGNPARNRALYEAVRQQMDRDYSPTYWFRVIRAQQLLALYRRNPVEFSMLAAEYRSEFSGSRAPHRLSVWLKRNDLMFRSVADIQSELGRNVLARAFDRPSYFGYALDLPRGGAAEAHRAAIGALTYIAYETRILHQRMAPPGESFQPLAVVALVEPEEYASQAGKPEALAHASGQVFDIDYSNLPPGQRECLRFVLDDLGWGGYLGFVEEGSGRLHVGCSPGAREFFSYIFEQAAGLEATD